MLITRLHPPIGNSLLSFARQPLSAETCLKTGVAQPTIANKSPLLTFVRHASHKAQGAVNGTKNGPGKRLGAKKTGEQYVIPGNIIFRQRGTHWFPGENCAMGRDHTIYATESGYVRYYKDPHKHPKRQFIGVVFERNGFLPRSHNAPRNRRFGRIAVPISSLAEDVGTTTDLIVTDSAVTGVDVKQTPKQLRAMQARELVLKKGYMYRQANWEIGRAAERANIKVRPYRRDDRWTAWKKALKRRATNATKHKLKPRKKAAKELKAAKKR